MPKIIKIEQIRELATKRGGKCLSSRYRGAFEKLQWSCSEGHIWRASPDSVKHGSWCPKCALVNNGLKRRKYSISDMVDLASKKGGKCLSKKCNTIQDKLEWECSEGHRWKAIPASIMRGGWCRICGISRSAKKRSIGIEKLVKIAKKRGGVLLSNTYINQNIKLDWKCAKEHTWSATAASVQMGHWCPKCANEKRSIAQRGNIEEMIEIARMKGGDCLSKYYVNSQTNLKWKCADGHTWEARPGNIKSGFWCPECTSLVGEKLVRSVFENIFQKKFPKLKPGWLLSKNGNRMELDGYCQEMRLAFEHHGRHHYEISAYSNTPGLLKKRKLDDLWKQKKCEENGVILIVIPEVGYLLKMDKLTSYIIKELKKSGFNVASPSLKISIDQIQKESSQIKFLQKLASEKKGKLISEVYLGNNRKHLWECRIGHRWETSPGKVKQGRWCHECNKKKKFTLEKMIELAKARGGLCLSKRYVNGKTKLKWECAKGHVWSSLPTSIHAGHWCPKCAQSANSDKQRGNLKELIEIAKANGGKCLSKVYVNAREKLSWQCQNGHIWQAPADSIKSGRWCQKCYYERRRTKV